MQLSVFADLMLTRAVSIALSGLPQHLSASSAMVIPGFGPSGQLCVEIFLAAVSPATVPTLCLSPAAILPKKL